MLSYQGVLEKLDPKLKKSEYSIANGKLTTVLDENDQEYLIKIYSNLDHLTLHWGLGLPKLKDWKSPLDFTDITFPRGTVRFDDKAAQSPFVEIIPTLSIIEIIISKENPSNKVNFVIKRDNSWFNNNKNNYSIVLSDQEVAPNSGPQETQNRSNEIIMSRYQEMLEKLDSNLKKTEYSVMNGKFATVVDKNDQEYLIKIYSNLDNLILHWGLSVAKLKDWKCPLDFTDIAFPAGTVKFDDKAVQSPFIEIMPNLSAIEIIISKENPSNKVNFVIKRDNNWFNNNNSNYTIVLKEDEVVQISGLQEIQNLVNEIIKVETQYGSWTLMHRFKLCNEFLNRLGTDIEALGWIFVWMRYSALRKLDWQRRFNTRPSELASSQQNLTYTLASLCRNASVQGLANPLLMLRGILSTMGKGGNNGQRIRDQILEIMHRNGIKEYQNYYEQWHQKLHNNTTPDDIGICEATIAFNETNNMGKFWEVLNKHGITRERLKSFERPITMEPYYAPQLVGDLYSYLQLLKAVHGSADLSSSVESCRGFLPGDLQAKLGDILANLKHWEKITQMEKTLNARLQLKTCVNKDRIDQYREILYLDMGLEAYMRQLCEEIIHLDIKIKHLLKELAILLRGVQITVSHPELEAASNDYYKFADRLVDLVENDLESALILKASCDRLQRVLGTYVDAYNALIDKKAKILGSEFGVEPHFYDIFAEESIRGSLLFAVSMVLKKIDAHLRRFCNFKSWQVISPKPSSSGKFLKVDSLHSVAYTVYQEPTVLLSERVTGEEEIPDNVVAVISCTELDALAHVSVRARNNKVLLAVCFDSEEIQGLSKYIGSWVSVTMVSGGISISATQKLHEERKEVENRQVKTPLPLEKIIIVADEFGEGKTGAKGNNCAALKRSLPTDIGVPVSVALPYGTYEYVLNQDENLSIKAQIEELLETLIGKEHDAQAKDILDRIKAQVLLLSINNSDKQIIQNVLTAIGCGSSKWDEAWKAIKSVWGSKYNERAYLSIVKAKIDISLVVMSVLGQEVISGDYAYVLHTKNPFNNNSQEIYGELVIGLGETLVGAYEGRALSFIVNKSNNNFEITSFPNKSVGLKGSGFIFRSDSNSEDLPGFAGAGLFDSYLMEEPKETILSYADDEIIKNKGFRINVIQKLKQVGLLVENFYSGVPQDIEGVILGYKVFVVQARPQV